MIVRKIRLIVLLPLCLLTARLFSLSEFPELNARSAVLIDATTGQVLFEKNADALIAPASLTKLMTMHIILDEVKRGLVRLDDLVDLPQAAWAINQEPNSSLMFLAPGQIVSVRELLLGLAVSSGNDAAVAVALHSAGSLPAFVAKMNRVAANLNLPNTLFTEPSGISENNTTTAREFAYFCRFYLAEHPESLTEFHSVLEFAYPKASNVLERYRNKPGTIVQRNRNLLLDPATGVDGLKTGFIIESGYHFALTAKRNGTRLIAVLLGIPNSLEAAWQRAADGERLLNWGFENFRTIFPVIELLADQRIWKGQSDFVALQPAEALEFTIDNNRGRSIAYKVVRRRAVEAPVYRGESLAELVFYDELGELRRLNLLAADRVEAGSWIKRLIDAIKLLWFKLFNEHAL